jgi:hypothetical protein
MMKRISPELEKYLDNLNSWVKGRERDLAYSIQQFDKLIVGLSSGSLALSMGFVKDIVKITIETRTALLKVSWYSFAVSLILILFSQVTSYQANKLEIDISNDEIRQYKANHVYDPSDARRNKKFAKFFNGSTIYLNIFSFATLVIGIIIFILFVNQNI